MSHPNTTLRLGVNIDHVATLRNARGEAFPDTVRAANVAKEAGADGITIHLREDRRHIRDEDVFRVKSECSLPLNLEMAATDEMLNIALQAKPNACCIVPEKREELTTEGGLDVIGQTDNLRNLIISLKGAGIRVSLFIDPVAEQIHASKALGADIVELHTGTFCHTPSKENLHILEEAAMLATQLGLECHAGHGITYETVEPIAAIPEMVELNIGHFLISESVFVGLKESITNMRSLMDKARA
jgi:pyridoxine 5-phosphate synthase